MGAKMKSKRSLGIVAVVLGVVLCSVHLSEAIPMGTAFTYQGFLHEAGIPADGLYDLEFRVYDDPAAGIQQGSTVMLDDEDIIDGSFAVELDFGTGVFEGDARWLEIGVRLGSSTGAFTPMLPRQELTLTPYALYAVSSGGFPVPLLVSGSSLAPIIEGINTGSGVGVRGHASSSNGDGIYGTAAGGSGRGVVGVASNGGDVENYGGYFTAAGEDGHGVHGYASHGGDTMNCGGYFEAAGNWGRGVYAKSTGEQSRGVWGETAGKYGIGVEGVGTGDWSHGVYGAAGGSNGRGVFGRAYNTGDVENYGGHFTAKGQRGRGIYAEALSGDGTGENYGGYFVAGNNGKGVYAQAAGDDAIAVQGLATSAATTAVNYGGHFTTYGHNGRGVYGAAVGGGGPNFGGYFEATGYYGNGVYGKAPGLDGTGVHGIALGGNGRAVVGQGQKYDFYAEGPGTNYGSTSSIRWKSDIRPIGEALDKIMNLRGVYFNWDADHGGQHDVGMIAEEVGQVLPEIVEYEENGTDATGMDYSKLTPLLVEAVKTLNTQVCELQERQLKKDQMIEMLADQNRALTERLAAIASIVEQLTHEGKELSNEVF